MMKYAWCAVAMGFLAAGPVQGQSKGTQLARSKGWHDNLDGAKTTARMTGKPLMVVFRCDP